MFSRFIEIGLFMIEAYKHAWPYLLLTIPLAVVVNVSGISKYISKAFNAKPLVAILLATAVGAFSPFCSCGVIPVITALLISGVPPAAVMSFWLASPSMDPEVFFLSVSLLGMDLALWRLGGTFVMSLSGGYITHFLIKVNWLDKEVLRKKSSGKRKWSGLSSFRIRPVDPVPVTEFHFSEQKKEIPLIKHFMSESTAPPSIASSCSTSGCGSECSTDSSETGKTKLIDNVLEESRRTVFMILKFMTLAFFLEALIILYLPQAWITDILGRENSFAIPVSALISLPLYTSNLTALGLMGGLLEQGMSPAAVLAFLIGGATTTIPAMAAVYGLVKKRVFILYILFTLGAALTAAYLYQFISFIMT